MSPSPWIVSSVVEMLSPMLPPPWRVVQKDIPPAGQVGLFRGLTDRYLCMNMDRDPQTCSMSEEPKKYLQKTFLPAHRYWESTAIASALVGARHTSSQIWGVLAFLATQKIKRRWISFSGDSTRAKGAAAATEGEAAAMATSYY